MPSSFPCSCPLPMPAQMAGIPQHFRWMFAPPPSANASCGALVIYLLAPKEKRKNRPVFLLPSAPLWAIKSDGAGGQAHYPTSGKSASALSHASSCPCLRFPFVALARFRNPQDFSTTIKEIAPRGRPVLPRPLVLVGQGVLLAALCVDTPPSAGRPHPSISSLATSFNAFSSPHRNESYQILR